MSKPSGGLLLYFDAPMQSWGYQSRFKRRTTLGFPTRSGVTGLLCAALGIPRSDRTRIAEVAGLDVTVFVIGRNHPIRRLNDFHTVGGGYDPAVFHERAHMVPKANGAMPDPVITYREYLLDARYGVLLRGDSGMLERCDSALRNPRWGIWLGRKSCIPASPVSQGFFTSEETAAARLEQISEGKIIQCIRDAHSFNDGDDVLHDVPLDFAKREYTVRRYRIDRINGG